MKSTTRFKNNKKGLECLNCGQPLQYGDNFCSNCGQVNDELPLSIKQFISEFFAGFFSFDSRFFKTIVPLLFKPGKVSKEYIQGKRKKYTNPFQLYLHTSIVFFLLIGLINTISDIKKLNNNFYTTNTVNKDSIINAVKKKLDQENISYATLSKGLDHFFEINDYKKIFNDTTISNKEKDSLFDKFLDQVINHQGLNLNVDVDLLNLKNFKLNKPNFNENKIRRELIKYFEENDIHYHIDSNIKINKNKTYFEKKEGKFGNFIDFYNLHKDMSPAEALDSLKYKKTRLNLFLYQKTQDLDRLITDRGFQKSYFKAILSKISIAVFFLLPLLSLIFSFLYLRHSYRYTEHLVVVFNIQTVFFLMLIVGIVLDSIFSIDSIVGILMLVFAFYVYKTLRNFYGQGRFKSIIKFFIINITYFILSVLGVLTVSFLAFFI